MSDYEEFDLDDPEFQEKSLVHMFRDLGRGYRSGLGITVLQWMIPHQARRPIFFAFAMDGLLARRRASKPLWFEIPLLGYGLWKTFAGIAPSYRSLLLIRYAEMLFDKGEYHYRYSNRIADKVAYWMAACTMEQKLLMEAFILTIFQTSWKLGVGLTVVLPYFTILIIQNLQILRALLAKMPAVVRFPVERIMSVTDRMIRFLFFRMVPRFYGFMETLEKKRLIQEHQKLRQKPLYSYQPIQGERMFRVLVLARRRLFCLPTCRFDIASLDDAPAHVAISYVWGSEKLSRSIAIDGSRLDITESAYEVLRHQQSFLAERRIWIDVICINQRDLREKAEQIQEMKVIYGHALWVDAYLGYGNDDIDFWTLILLLSDSNIPSHDFNASNSTRMFTTELKPYWTRLFEMVNSPWFSRIWVLQEAIHARDLYVIFGCLRIPWPEFKKVITALDRLILPPTLVALQPAERRQRMSNIHESALVFGLFRKRLKRDGSDTLYNLLSGSRGLQSSEPRDKVYGLLGLADPLATIAIPIDYQISLRVLLIRTMLWTLLEDEMYCLIGCGDVDESLRPAHLPSWVVDWTNPGVSWSKSTIPTWNAAIKLKRSVPDVPYRPSPTGERLLVNMMLLSEHVGESVEKTPVSHEHIHPGYLQDNMVADHVWLSKAREIILKHSKPSESKERKEMFYRTLLCDLKDPDVEDALHWDDPNFESDYKLLEAWLGIGLDVTEALAFKVEKSLQKAYDTYRSANPSEDHHMSYLEALMAGVSFVDPGDPAMDQYQLGGQWTHERAAKILFRLRFAYGRRIGVTSSGRVASFPKNAKHGDEICLIACAPAPFVVRRSEPDTYHGSMTRSIVGWCYLHGAMDGSLATGPWDACWLT